MHLYFRLYIGRAIRFLWQSDILGMSIVLNGQLVPIFGVETLSWLDDPHVPMTTDGNPRREWIRGIVLHTVHGKLGSLLPGVKVSSRAEAFAVYQANTSRDVSWDYTIDTDGTVIASNDPLKRACWHATSVNAFTIGIELVQENNGDIYQGQVDATVKFLDALTRELADRGHPIQRQVPIDAHGKPVRGVIPRIVDPQDSRSVVGIYGHRNQTSNRGPGDPGDFVFQALLDAGYKGFNYDHGEDLIFWKAEQTRLGFSAVDGVPGCGTQEKLLAEGHKHGLLIARPND